MSQSPVLLLELYARAPQYGQNVCSTPPPKTYMELLRGQNKHIKNMFSVIVDVVKISC